MRFGDECSNNIKARIIDLPGIAVTGVLVAARLLPMPVHDRIFGLPSICPFHAITSKPCPACGLTRSFVCFAHGDLTDAFRYHSLGPLLFATAVIWLICRVSGLEVRVPTIRQLFEQRLPLPLSVLFLAAWAARLAGVDPLP